MSGTWKAAGIAKELEQRIRAGTYVPGERLPSVAEIADEFGVARNTANSAVKMLAREKFVISDGSRGTLVLDWRTPRQVRRQRAVYEDDFGFYFDPVAKDWVRATPKSRVTWEKVSDEIADILEIPYGADVLIREMVTGQEVEIGPGRKQVNPKQVCSTTVPADIAREHDLGREETGPGGVLFRLRDAYGRLKFTDTLFARMATPREAELLQLGGAEIPLLVSVTKVIAKVDGRDRVVAANNIRMDGRSMAIEHNLRSGTPAK